jgi:superfamily II DNA/RNA helicase
MSRNQASASGGHDISLKRVRRTAEPEFKTCSDEALAVPWYDLKLSRDTMYAMGNVCHFSHATYVQAEVIPHFLQQGNSVIIEAATGSGKTLAFIVPVMERLVRLAESHFRDHREPLRSRRIVGAVFSPSRVLAQQTYIVARSVACRVTQVLHFVLCDLSLQKVETIVGHLRRANKITGTVLVGTPSDVERVCCALKGRPYVPVPLSGTSSAVGSDDDEDALEEGGGNHAYLHGMSVADVKAMAEGAIAGADAEAGSEGGESDGLDEEEMQMLRVAREKRAKRRAARSEAEKDAAIKAETKAKTEDVAEVAPNPGCPILLVVDEADVVMKSTRMRATITRLVDTLRLDHPDVKIDVGLFGATVSSAPQVPEFVKNLRLPTVPKHITLGSNEQFVNKLTNRFIYVPGTDMLQALVHLLNAHPAKKHFVFFNNPVVLLHVRAVLNSLTDGARPLLHTGKIFALHEGMKDAAKFAEFGRFLRFTAHDWELQNMPKAKTTKEARKMAAAQNARDSVMDATHLEGYANGTKRTGSVLHHATGAVLLCTDVAAFGLDVRDVDYVIHFEAPTTVRSYIHRIGRVARMGMRGVSTMLLPVSESSPNSPEAGESAVDPRMNEYIKTLTEAHQVERAGVAGNTTPISSNIRGVVSRSEALANSAKNAALAMANTEGSWYDVLTAIDALTAGAGR